MTLSKPFSKSLDSSMLPCCSVAVHSSSRKIVRVQRSYNFMAMYVDMLNRQQQQHTASLAAHTAGSTRLWWPNTSWPLGKSMGVIFSGSYSVVLTAMGTMRMRSGSMPVMMSSKGTSKSCCIQQLMNR
jgi:hypothetical protein